MQLILWRHAEAHDGAPDAERKLTAKGKRHAKRVANWLRKRLPKGARILVSPAVRTRRTARELSREYETEPAVGLSANAAGVLKAAGWPGAGEEAIVVVVGHQPTLGEAAALALTGRAAAWSLEKGALVWLESDDGHARLKAALTPELA